MVRRQIIAIPLFLVFVGCSANLSRTHERESPSITEGAPLDPANWRLLKRILFGLGFALATCVVSAGVAVFLIVRMPATYFNEETPKPLSSQHPAIRWMALVLKNLLGVVLMAAGIMMLFTPGQGVLTIVIGAMLLDFPGRRKLLQALLSRARIREAINSLRARFGKPPLVFDQS